MNVDDIEQLGYEQLASLLQPEVLDWSGEDMRIMLRHQLAADILSDLQKVPGIGTRAQTLNISPNRTFADELTAFAPDVNVLQSIKEFAQHVHRTPENPLHGPA